MNRIKMFESFNKIIEDSLIYYKRVEDKHKKVMAKQIALTASTYIKYRQDSLENWLDAFKDEPLVIDELNKLK